MGSPGQDYAVAGHQLSGTNLELVADGDRLDGDVLELHSPDPVGYVRSRPLQLAHRCRRPALRIALECLATALHEDDDQPGERLVEEQRGDDREHRDDVGGESPRHQAARRSSHHGSTGQHQAGEPEPVARRRAGDQSKQQAAKNEEQCRGRDQRGRLHGRNLAARP